VGSSCALKVITSGGQSAFGTFHPCSLLHLFNCCGRGRQSLIDRQRGLALTLSEFPNSLIHLVCGQRSAVDARPFT